MNIHNFANRNLCEYASIFPTVAALLDHLLFTIGNGFDFDEDSGMIFDNGKRIDEYPKMTKAKWDKLIAACHAKELKWAEQFGRGKPEDAEQLAEDCAKYKIVNVNDVAFSEDALYNDLVRLQAERRTDFLVDTHLRPYPLSEKYSDVCNLNANTPEWFVQIALNFCKAWVHFLNEAIANNDVWIKPSLRPKTAESVQHAAAMSALFDEIKADPAYDGWANNTKEPERDYADFDWTVTHRDMIQKQVERLEGLLK